MRALGAGGCAQQRRRRQRLIAERQSRRAEGIFSCSPPPVALSLALLLGAYLSYLAALRQWRTDGDGRTETDGRDGERTQLKEWLCWRSGTARSRLSLFASVRPSIRPTACLCLKGAAPGICLVIWRTLRVPKWGRCEAGLWFSNLPAPRQTTRLSFN